MRAGARHHSLLHAAEFAESAVADSVCLSVCSTYSSMDTPIVMLAQNNQPTEFDRRKK